MFHLFEASGAVFQVEPLQVEIPIPLLPGTTGDAKSEFNNRVTLLTDVISKGEAIV
jgi:hypothetical protein